jgi:spore germination cell wall hydrolase CwlJ-like protein
MRRDIVISLLAGLLGLFGCAAPRGTTASGTRLLDGLGQEKGMDAAMLALARRLDPGRRGDIGGRTPGWAALDIATPPRLDFGPLTPLEARRVNGWLPSIGVQASAADPFFLRAANPERDRALLCLTQAIYYEAALEPTAGQEAVAQVVLNRLRHPAFPKSICGVVYQGASQATGCQFSFTCDGSRARPPMRDFWDRAAAVAQAAVRGFVMKDVGSATSYHADYVFPRWGPTLVKIRQIGAHIFYRFPGPAGQPDSLRGRYAGGELAVSMAGPSPQALAQADSLGSAGPVPGSSLLASLVTDRPGARGGMPGRRAPTPDEIARINAALASMDRAAP